MREQKITDALLKTDGVQGVIAVNDFSLLTQVQSTNSGFFFVALKPWDKRKTKQQQLDYIQSHLQRQLMANPSGIAFAFPPPSIPGIGTSGGVTMILEDRSGGDDPTVLAKNVFAFLGAASKRPEIAAVIPSYQPAVPQLYADVDKAKALQQQVQLSDIYTTMSTFMGGYLVNYFNRFGRQWQTYVEAEGTSRQNIENISQFYVRSANGSQVPLSSLVKVTQTTGPEFIYRFNEYNAAQLNITGSPGYSSGQVRHALEEVFKQTMPAGAGFDYSGMSYQEQQAEKGVPSWAVFGLSLLFVFLILAALYESWTLPFSVLLSTPVAILGGYLALHIRSFENDIFATIGLVMLIGLSAKNAILIVEFAKTNYEAGQSIAEAALAAARLRFRPIVMTALAFVFGCLPLWVASGAGGASRRILGTVVVGGMFLSTAIGLIFIPVTFSVVEYLSHRYARGGKGTTMDSKGDLDPVAVGAAAGRLDPRRSGHEQLSGLVQARVRQSSLPLCCWLRQPDARLGRSTSGPRTPRRPHSAGRTMPRVISDAQGSLGDEQWAQVFREPELQDLIRKALSNNYDLRIAAQRILEQQAQVQITRSQQFPTLSVGGTGVGVDIPGISSYTGGGANSISSPIVVGSFSLLCCVEPGLLGPLSQADGSCPGYAPGANLGPARGAPDAGAGSGDSLHSTARTRSASGGHPANIEGQAGVGRPDDAAGEWRLRSAL